MPDSVPPPKRAETAARIRAVMEAKRFSVAEIARRLGRRPNWVSKRLLGNTVIDADLLPAFAEALDVSVGELLGLEPSGYATWTPAELEAWWSGIGVAGREYLLARERARAAFRERSRSETERDSSHTE